MEALDFSSIVAVFEPSKIILVVLFVAGAIAGLICVVLAAHATLATLRGISVQEQSDGFRRALRHDRYQKRFERESFNRDYREWRSKRIRETNRRRWK